MSDAQQPEPIVFYTDSCLGRMCAEALRAEGFRVERHLDHFAEDTPDVDWLPIVSQRGWVILSKDKNIRYRPLELKAVINSGTRMVVLGTGNYTGRGMVNIILAQLDKILDHVARHPGPFIVSISNSGFRVVYPKSTNDSKSDIQERPGKAGELD